MIKSSWFYVKFKYAEKVSQYVFFSQGKPATSFWFFGVDSSLSHSGEQSLEVVFVTVFPFA